MIVNQFASLRPKLTHFDLVKNFLNDPMITQPWIDLRDWPNCSHPRLDPT